MRGKSLDFTRVLLPCLLGFALLVLTLNAQSLWWDEGISLHLATSSWSEIIADRARNIHPPLYFFALKLWVALGGRSPFVARYASALAGMILPVAVYRFLGRRIGRRAGRAGAFLVALAPPFFVYAQEVRAYAFLPSLALALLGYVWPPKGHLLILESGSPDDGGQRCGFFKVGGLIFVEGVLCLMHYAGGVAVAWANLAFCIQCFHRKRRRVWLTWAFTLLGVVALLLPWAGAVLRVGAVGLKREAGLGNVLDDPLPGGYLLKLLGVFHAVGLPSALADPVLTRSASLVGGLALLALIWVGIRSLRSGKGSPMFALLLAWGLPLTMVPIVWSLSPQAHPRYLLPFVLGAWLLGAVLVTSPQVPRGMQGALLAAALTMNILGLRAYWVEPRYGRSDVRSVAAFIRENARPGDVALMPYTDWTLSHYDLGAATGAMVPPRGEDERVTKFLAEVTQAGQNVYALDYRRGALDLRNQIRTTLAYGGILQQLHTFPGVLLWEYMLSAPASMPSLNPLDPPVCQTSGPLCLVAAVYQQDPESGDALPLALRWTQRRATSHRYAVALRLYAPSGALVAMQDDVLINAALRPTDRWGASRVVTTYHLLPLPVGLLPKPYRLDVGLYTPDGASEANAPSSTLARAGQPPMSAFTLGTVTPKIQPWVEVSAYALSPGPLGPRKSLGSGLLLEGASLDRTEVYPGQTVFVTMRWRASEAFPDGLPRLILRQEGDILTDVPVLMDLPPMPTDRPLLEHVALGVPAGAGAGPAQAVLTIGNESVVLGEVWVKAGQHIFDTLPLSNPLNVRVGDIATLLGYTLEVADKTSTSRAPGEAVRVNAGAPFTLTLIWRADDGASGTDLTVFTHLLGTDHTIVAQHDAKPVAWTRPTGGWVSGEILVDQHRLTWQRTYGGSAELFVGLYDATTGARVLWQNGQDAFKLPVMLMVKGPDS